MRKQIIDNVEPVTSSAQRNWLDLEHLARVEITSEDANYPIEAVFQADNTTGWRAAKPGEQIIRIIFDHPQKLRHIFLHFVEAIYERRQEFVLRWSADKGETFREIVRQQWNFNSQTSATEIENYQVELEGVTILELKILPDANGSAPASLMKFQLA